jgi:hypothetical protein
MLRISAKCERKRQLLGSLYDSAQSDAQLRLGEAASQTPHARPPYRKARSRQSRQRAVNVPILSNTAAPRSGALGRGAISYQQSAFRCSVVLGDDQPGL